MEWFAGTGEVKTKPLIPGMDVDTFNTNLIARLTSILMIDSLPEKVRYLHAFVRWLNNGYQYADGTRGTFKIDGTMFHHRHNYPAYAVGGLQGAVAAVYLLRNTSFKISEQSHRILKKPCCPCGPIAIYKRGRYRCREDILTVKEVWTQNISGYWHWLVHRMEGSRSTKKWQRPI